MLAKGKNGLKYACGLLQHEKIMKKIQGSSGSSNVCTAVA